MGPRDTHLALLASDAKADLLVEVVEQGAALFQASADRVENAGGTGAEQLAALVEGHVDVVLDHIDEARTFLYEADALDETHRQRVLAARDRYEAAFRRVLVTGAKDGSFQTDLDPAITAIMILSILNAVERWYRPGGRLDRRQLAAEILRFCSNGVGT